MKTASKDTYICKASNSEGAIFATIQVAVAGVKIPAALLIIALIGIVSCLVILTVIGIALWRNKLKQSNEAIVFLTGGERDNFISNILKTNSKVLLKSSLSYDLQGVLGFGKYGLVLKGFMIKDNDDDGADARIPIAIKTMKPNMKRHQEAVPYFKALLSDVTVMARLASHPNVVAFYGACLENIQNGNILIATEFCAKGDLLSFLRKQKALEGSSFIVGDNSISCSCRVELLEWSRDIASGLSFLSSENVIHGDLNARNVLLSKDNVAKIVDGGLSRQRLNDYTFDLDLKKSKKVGSLPWKWMALESLTSSTFTLKSDVWSFGVTLWEIFSLGCPPYAEFEYNANFVECISSGYKLPIAEYANEEIYSVMKSCWETDPDCRPAIASVLIEIQEILYRLTISKL